MALTIAGPGWACSLSASSRKMPASCSRPFQHSPLLQQQQRTRRSFRGVPQAARAEAGGGGGEDLVLPPGGGPRKRADWQQGPRFGLSREEACEMQLEVCYRYANLDPFERSRYFGRSLDLGQFERFRRVFFSPAYSVLLRHSERSVLSSLELADDLWRLRVLVVGRGPSAPAAAARGEEEPEQQQQERVFEFTMYRHLGGRFDGIWFTQSLTADGVDYTSLIV